MLEILRARWQQKRRTIAFPAGDPVLPDRFRGLPALDASKCPTGCQACAQACPTGAITEAPRLAVDLGRCLFCGACAAACPGGAIQFSRDYRLAVRRREDLVQEGASPYRLADALDAQMRRVFGRSLKLREVSAAGCNACEADVNVLNTVVFDLGRFGIQFVASPRHADGLLITGCVSRNMELALRKTYAAVPAPKLVIAVGACACSGGIYRDRPEQCNGADPIVPVDLYVPGCPPHPVTILDGLLRLLGKMR